MVLYYTKGLCCVLSGVCYITGRMRKGKGSVGLLRYHYYCEPTKDPALSRDSAFIIIIMLFSWPLNKTRHLYETGGYLRQYGSKTNNSTGKFWVLSLDFPASWKLICYFTMLYYKLSAAAVHGNEL